MPHLFYNLVMELKRSLSRRNLLILLITFLIMLFFINKGIIEQKSLPDKIQKFKQIQKNLFVILPSYEGYSIEGIQFLFIPAPVGIMVRNAIISLDLNAKANSIITLKISSNMKGKVLISGLFFGRIDFSLIVLLLVSLLAMAWGFESLHTGEYLKCLASTTSSTRVFFATALARYLCFALGFVVMAAGTVVFILLRGIHLSSPDYTGIAVLLLVSLGLLLFFFSIGVALGTIESEKTAVFSIFCLWLLLVIFIPGFFVSANENQFPDVNRDFQTELNKFTIISDFEKKLYKEYGKFTKDKKEIFKNFAEKYWNTDFKQVQNKDIKSYSEIKAAIERVEGLSVLIPTTFYMYTANEVSSCGYENFLSFYDYVLAMRVKFVRFWIDRVYYHDPLELVSFIKAEENIFRGRSRVPRQFLPGMVFMLFYSLLVLFYGYIRFKAVLYPRAEKANAFDRLDIKLEIGKKYTYQSHGKDFVNQFLKVFYGKSRGIKMKVSISGKEITPGSKQDFLYVPHPDSFPGDMNALHLLSVWQGSFKVSREDLNRVKQSLGKELLRKRFFHLQPEEKARVVLSLAGLSRSRVYILKDFLFGIPKEMRDKLEDQADGLMEAGGLMVDLSTLNSYSIASDVTATISYRDGYYIEVR